VKVLSINSPTTCCRTLSSSCFIAPSPTPRCGACHNFHLICHATIYGSLRCSQRYATLTQSPQIDVWPVVREDNLDDDDGTRGAVERQALVATPHTNQQSVRLVHQIYWALTQSEESLEFGDKLDNDDASSVSGWSWCYAWWWTAREAHARTNV
jgi:hypothetical protein